MEQMQIFWHELCSYLSPDVFSTPLQLFHELADQLRGVSFTDVGWLSFKGVANAHQNRHVRVFYRERGRRILPVIFVAIRLEIVQDRVRVTFCFNFWLINIINPPNFAHPSLDHAVASFSKPQTAFHCHSELVFTCFIAAVNYFVSIAWETFRASVPVAAVVLEYCLCFMVVPIHRYPLIDYRFSLTAGLEMPFQMTILCKSHSAMRTYIIFPQPGDILDDERVPFVDTDCQNVLHTG